MDLFVSVDGDSIGQQVGRASLADDVSEVRRLSKLITDGNDLWTKWALGTGGQVVSAGGDEVVVQVDASRIGEIPALRQQYQDLVGASASVGIGMRLSEAQKALLTAKLDGKDQIVTYGPHVENTIQNMMVQEDEQQKLGHEYLARAEEVPEAIQGTVDDPHMQALLQHMDGGHGEDGDREEKQPQDMLADFHTAADKQKKDAEDHAKEAANDGLKMKVAAIIQQLKADPRALAVLQQKLPQQAKAISEMAQAMIAMGRQLWAEQEESHRGEPAEVEPTAKAELKMPPLKPFMLSRDHKVGMKVPEGGSSCANCKFLKSDGKTCGNAVWVKWHKNDPVIPAPADEYCCDGFQPQGNLVREPVEKGGPEGEIVPEKEAENIEKDESADWGFSGQNQGRPQTPMVPANNRPNAGGGAHESKSEPSMTKAALEAGKTGRHNVILPDGSQKDTSPSGAREGGKRKVSHADGHSSWQSMRSGVVPSPTGRPTSAHHPGGLPKDKPQLSPEHYGEGDEPQGG